MIVDDDRDVLHGYAHSLRKAGFETRAAVELRDGDAAPTEGKSRTKACVLVVEDDADIRQLVADSLCGAGYRVLQAGDGREALALAAGERPSLIVTDLEMPGMNGWELLKALRADASLSNTPVIVASASEEVPAEASAQVVKPFRPESLLAAVQAVLRSAQA